MDKSTKAVLLSALVLPGAGHVFLKKYIMAFILVGISICGVYYIMSIALSKATDIIYKIQLGEVQPDLISIMELVSKQSNITDTQSVNIATTSIIVCWVVGIVDSYRVARLQEKNN